MEWRARPQAEVLAVLLEHGMDFSDRFTGLEELAKEIAEAMPSPDPRNGYVIVPVAQLRKLVQEALGPSPDPVRVMQTLALLETILESIPASQKP